MSNQYTILQDDYDLATHLGLELRNRPDIALDTNKLSGVLADVLKGNGLELNVLRILLNEGIIYRLVRTQESNDSIYNTFVMILEQRYGISSTIAQRMVWIWLYSYRAMVLGREVSFQFAPDNSTASKPVRTPVNLTQAIERETSTGNTSFTIRFCPACGARVNQGAKYCPAGHPIQLSDIVRQAKEQQNAYSTVMTITSESPNDSIQKQLLNALQSRSAAASRLMATTHVLSFAVKKDGTVLVTTPIRSNSMFGFGQGNVSSWRNIVAIAASLHHTIGLKSDGSVVSAGYNGYNQCSVSSWRNIIAIATGNDHTVGLKQNGSVIATGSNSHCECFVGEWRDIVAIAAGYNHTVGLKSDGTVVTTRFEDDLSRWHDIVAIAADGNTTLGLQADGTVLRKTITYEESYSGEDIVGIGGESYGIKKDGSVIELHYRKRLEQINDVIAISVGYGRVLGLKADGTIVSTKYNGSSSSYYGQDRVSGWKLF